MELTRKRLFIIAGIAGLILIVGVSFVLYFFVFRLPPEIVEEEPETIIQPTEPVVEEEPIVSKLDGLEIGDENEEVIAVIIENHNQARTQMSGLSQASVVFEAEAEGGITRFLALFPYQNTEKVGPVRSARPYYVAWAEMFNSAIAHAGGSDAGLRKIYTSGRVLDLDGLALEGGLKYFVRDYTFEAPHNLFANLEELRALMAQRNWKKPVEEPFLTFGPLTDIPFYNEETVDSAILLSIYYPYPQYYVNYRYDEENNNYLRFHNSIPHIDSLNHEQITASNVLVLFSTYYAGDAEGRLAFTTDGSGDLYLFRDGKIITGTWKKPSAQSVITFYNEEGSELVFSPGPTWISVISKTTPIEWE